MAELNLETDLESRTLLYVFSAALVSLGILLFSLERSQLSPLTKIFALMMFAAGSYLGGRVTGKKLILDVVAVVSLLSAINHYSIVYRPGLDAVFVAMALGAGLAAAAGYASDKVHSGNHVKLVIVAIGIAVVIAGAVDIYGGQPNYVLNLQDSVSPGDSSAGTLVAQNSFFLPRNAEIPSYEVCRGEEKPLFYIEVESGRTLLEGGSVEQYELEIRANRLNNSRVLEKRESCPAQPTGSVVIVERENRFD